MHVSAHRREEQLRDHENGDHENGDPACKRVKTSELFRIRTCFAPVPWPQQQRQLSACTIFYTAC